MQQTTEGRLDRIESKLDGLRQMVEKCSDMVWSLVVTRDEMRSVLKWQKEKESGRNRTAKCRENAKQRQEEHREWTIKNDPELALTDKRLGTNVKIGMMDVLKRLLKEHAPHADPVKWFVQQVDMHPPNHVIEFLVCLYNRSFWEPWIKPNADGKWIVFQKWNEKNGKACNQLKNKLDVLYKTDPPANKWETPAVEKFGKAWIWKVFEVLFAFVDDMICDASEGAFERNVGREKFWELALLMSACSEHEVLNFEWNAPALATHPDRSKALKIYRKVSFNLKILQDAFQRGIRKTHEDLQNYFVVPK